MRMLFTLAAALAATPALAADPAVEAPIRAMEKGFNTGDVAMAKAAHAAAPMILDEPIAPFVWSGPTAFDDWIAALGKSETEQGKTDGKVALGPFIRESVMGDRAYVVARSSYTFRQRGRTMRETGTIAFALVKQDAAWKIQAWAWASPEAVPVK